MPANEQRRALTEVCAKLADDSLRPCGPAFLTSPCHAWMLPNGDHQRAPQEVALTHVPQMTASEGQQKVSPTPEVTPAESLQHMSNAPPIINAPNPTTRRALKSTKRVHLRLTRNNLPGTVPTIRRTQPLYSPSRATKKTPVRRSPRLQKNAPTNKRHKSPSTIPQTPTCPNCRPFAQPQHHQPTSFTYTCRQCVGQHQPQFYTKNPTAKGKNKCNKFGTFGNANGTSNDG